MVRNNIPDICRKNILEAYAAIGDLTPLTTDCGALCGRACCLPDEDGQGGMLLFPGEDDMCAGDWRVIEHTDAGDILYCSAPCPRDVRPLACRIFPLTPVFSKGVWTVRMDARACAMCPLARSGVQGVDREFALAVRKALRIVASTAEGEEFLRRWQAAEDEFRSFRL